MARPWTDCLRGPIEFWRGNSIMHPAYSVIFFTTASGAGLGLLVWLCLFAALGFIERGLGLGLVGFGLALGLTTAGLLSSTFHLGRPERAWRAFSQWRSSWLSREGVVAVATFVPAGLAALSWLTGIGQSGPVQLAELLAVICALATLWCTGMIYACLTTIRAWNRPTVPWLYLLLGLATGGLMLTLLLYLFGQPTFAASIVTLVMLAIAGVLKFRYWQDVDGLPTTLTAGDATGLKSHGDVRVLDQPHSTDNFVMREMGYAVGRKHADKLRRVVMFALFALPILAVLIAMVSPTWLGGTLLVAAVGLAGIGVVAERWLFFAQAKHVVTLYYGADAA